MGDKVAGPEGVPGRLFLNFLKFALEEDLSGDQLRQLGRRPIRPVGVFSGSPVVKTPRFHCRGPWSILGWETKILYMISAAKKKKKKKKKDLQESRGDTVKAGNSSIESKASCGKLMLARSLCAQVSL